MSDQTASTIFNIVLIKPEIPHNTGAIGRLCVGLGCRLHLIRPLGFHLSNEYIQRAGLDYWEHLDLQLHDSWSDFVKTTEPRNLFFFSTKGSQSLYQCKFAAGDTLIFGSESRGFPEEIYMQFQNSLYTIPMPGQHARSINLANSVAIAAYEALRQIALN